jgi:cellulose synthase/poly-beta-1,6-N-acetylglucosamine synthase-like glycosyltransferase
LLAIPTSVFSLEILAAVFLTKRSTSVEEQIYPDRGTLAVLVPAHNESANLLPTLTDINGQLRFGDRLVVVADNCTDDTAAIAATFGAEITVRSDPTRIGKGYALDWGIRYLADKPPQTVIVVDADCRILPGTLECLAAESSKTGRPMQALYFMTAPAASKLNHQVAEFAWRLKNWVRPLGLHLLGMPCQLVGSGMAFPWEIIRSANLSTGFITEDLKLGLDLAAAGMFPRLCPQAIVTSTFQNSAQGTKSQRHRWEQGHIGLIVTKSLGLLFSAAARADTRLLILTLDLMVPPITLLTLLLIATVFLSAIATLAHASLYPVTISLISMILFVVAMISAWAKYGRDILPPNSLALISRYCFEKLNLYRAVLFGLRISSWIRTDRN